MGIGRTCSGIAHSDYCKIILKGSSVGIMLEGWTREQVLENYPELNAEKLQAVFAYGAAHLKDEDTFIFSDGTSG